MLPLHQLSLTLWFIMVHPGLISCHNSMEKSISFTSMMVQMFLTNHLLCTLVITGQLPWDPSPKHFLIPEGIMDNTVCRAMTHVEFYGIFINSDSPVVTDLLLDLQFHCLSCHTNWSPTPVFITDVLSSVLKSFHPFIHCPLRAGLDRCGKSHPPLGFNPRTIQPVASCYTDCTIPDPKYDIYAK